MSELMEEAKDHLPDGLYVKMWDQLKICKEDEEALIDATIRVVRSEISEILESRFVIMEKQRKQHYEYFVKQIEARDELIAVLRRMVAEEMAKALLVPEEGDI